MTRLFVLWLVAGSVLSGTGRADSSVHLRTTRTAEYLVSHWTSEQGLPQNTVTCLLQSRDGYLWLGTRYGLARFDGLRLTAYVEALGALDLGCLDVQGLAEDSSGVIWLSTAAGLVRFEQGRFALQPLGDSPVPAPVNGVRASRDGGVWVAQPTRLIELRGGQTMRTFDMEIDLGRSSEGGAWSLDEVREDARGRVWVSITNERQVEWLRFEPGTRRVETLTAVMGDGARGAWNLMEDRRGRLWAAQTNALLRWENGTVTCHDAARAWGNQWVHHWVEDHKGHIWALAHGSRQIYRFANGQFKGFGVADGLTVQDDFRSLLADREGNLWVGTGAGGVNRLQPRALLSMLGGSKTMMDEVYSVSPAPDGTVWMATSLGLVSMREGESRAVPSTVDQPDEGWILKTRPVLAGRGGQIWMGLDGVGLGILQDGEFRRVDTPNLRTEGVKRQVNSILEARSGDLWAGTSVGLLHGQAGHFRLWTTNDGLADNRVFGLAEGADGSLWVGTQGAGIARFRDGQFLHFTTNHGLLSQRAWPLRAEPDGTVWVGTPVGLNRIRGDEVRAVTMKDGLYDNLAYCLLDDQRGHYWTFGNRGIWRVRKADLHAVADGTGSSPSCINYGEADGMVSVEGNGDQQPNAAQLPNGELWFPTTRGVVVVHPSALRDNQVPPGVIIEEIRADEETIFRDGEVVGAAVPIAGIESASTPGLRLGPGRARILEIRFTATTFIDPEMAQFRYRLVGHDVGWRQGGAERVVFYTHLAPGRYRFEVMARNHHGYWSLTPAAFAFRLDPRFHQTRLFWVGCCFAAATVLVGWHRRRRRVRRDRQHEHHLRLLQKERGRIARDLHDELGASMTGIAMQMEVGAGSSDPTALSAHLRQSAGALRASVGRMRELVWTINSDCDTIESLCAFLGQYAEQFLQTAGLRCRLDLPFDVPVCEVSAAARHQLLMILKEALTNVVKHARASEVHFGVQAEESALQITVADNGRGVVLDAVQPPGEDAPSGADPTNGSRDALRPGHGLANMRQRAGSLGGTFGLTRGAKGGTLVTVRVPLARISHQLLMSSDRSPSHFT